VAALSLAAGAAHLTPSVAAIGPLRTALWPRLAGITRGRQVALTFDDGPDPRSTPEVLAALADLDVRATFFVLGARLARHPDLGGHEIAVHGWLHRPHLLRVPTATGRDLARTVSLVADTTGTRPRYWRPPHGIPTGAGLLAARRLGLRPVLWSADGRDWRADATPDSINARLAGRLAPGAVVLLHDSDGQSAPGSWRATVGALPSLVAGCRARGLPIGPLAEHGLEARHAHR
jgi:peptidoglycan/xylan/chitin deacetylase (PgdA/CDA1 family)